MTSSLFNDWFKNIFCKQVKKFMREQNLAFKILLILDNAPSHPVSLTCKGVTVVFLPPNTTSLIQPLDQGIISTFKSYYVKHALKHIIALVEGDESMNGIKAWKSLTIADCLDFIEKSLKDMTSTTLSACWKPLIPNLLQNSNGPPSLEDDFNEIRCLGDNLLDGATSQTRGNPKCNKITFPLNFEF